MKKKVSFSAACGIEKMIMREENEIEKNENDSADGVVEHSKVQVCRSSKVERSVRNFEPRGI